jgi:predicted ArsR family transcriptional regulator
MKRNNPSTSNEAYRQLKAERVRETYKQILFALSIIKEGTFEDIARQIGCKPDVIWKRLSELANDGKIYRPGNKRPLKSGRNGYTWMLITPGIAPAKIVEMSMPGTTVQDYSKKITSIQQDLF